ncbi:MAG TPA: Dabb family protein [Terrimicrobiaceae bacterium]|jgi:Stress responsive A/B Barrel Domain|nr:Dabb family protein [Terrimicrobiaceae bacterium]
MIYHLVLFKLKPEVDEAKLEWMMRETRIQLLRIPEVLSIRCGKRVDSNMEWPFFLSVELDSMEKLNLYAEDPNHVKFVEEVIKPNITERLALDYEMEPGKRAR